MTASSLAAADFVKFDSPRQRDTLYPYEYRESDGDGGSIDQTFIIQMTPHASSSMTSFEKVE